jgi:hypothetical protein
MKPWDGLDRVDAQPQRLPVADRQLLDRDLDRLRERGRHRSTGASGASLVGLALSLTMLAGMLWGLWPDSPVAPEVMR